MDVVRCCAQGEFVALGSSDGRIQLHDFARFEATMLPHYYNPPASKPQDIYRQETLFDGLSGVMHSLLSSLPSALNSPWSRSHSHSRAWPCFYRGHTA
jgi:hypothetical protein